MPKNKKKNEKQIYHGSKIEILELREKGGVKGMTSRWPLEDIFCFVSVFTQIFFKVIGNLWAYYKCDLGRMHHVGT